MPWLETSSVEQRERFIADERLGLYTRTELCARYGISRKTGYKWLDRFDEDGRRGPRDPSPPPQPRPPPTAPSASASRRRSPNHGRPQRSLDHRLQGAVPDARRRVVLSPHDRRSAHALSARLSGTAEHQGPGRPPGLRADLPGVRPAARDPDRQRRPLRLVRHPWPVPAQRLVDAARDPASAHSPRLAPGERGARTHAPDPESRGLSPTPCPSRRAATRVQSLSDGVQRRAAARLSRRPDAPDP